MELKVDEDAISARDGDFEGFSLCVAVLQQAINDFLTGTGPATLPPSPSVPRTCGCTPFCPFDMYLETGEDLGWEAMARCSRLTQLRLFEEYPASEWLFSPYEGPWSYRWICAQFKVDPEVLLKRILKLPRGKPLRVDGHRLYRQSRVSYDAATHEVRKAEADRSMKSTSELLDDLGVWEWL